MFLTIESFKKSVDVMAEGTSNILKALNDVSLKQKVTDGHRDIGRIAWHIIQSIPEMGNRTGLEVAGPGEKDTIPEKADQFVSEYAKAIKSLADDVISKWSDKDLMVEDDMYGQQWARGLTLKILMDHEVHHRGQMTVLMRQAGLKVPGVMGPSLEEWEKFGMENPEI